MKEKLEQLKKQQESARELFIKCQGAIEFLEGMMKEEEEKKKDEPKVLNGDLILYDKKGNIIVHSDENSE